ncbi:M15 family metallopeptidase [Candidatus Dojkabacteria bacterium]|nr:M15 family metallopeptidase [Candidatus Dojkabacteria bacterium]
MKSKRLKTVLILLLIFLLGYFAVDFLPTKKGSESNLSENTVVVGETKDSGLNETKPLPKPNSLEEYNKVEEPAVEKPSDTTTTPAKDKWWAYPKEIKETTRSGDDLLVLVNKEYKLPSTYAPKDLVYANTSGIRVTTVKSYMLRSIVINDLKALNDDAKLAGLDLSVISGYRSYSTQASTYQYWVNYNGGNADVVDQISARPGHSQHQLGTAMDFSSSEIGDRLGSEFDNTKAGEWLAENAWKYGFVISYPKGFERVTGYDYESWHYRYIGRENAKEMKDSGEILEVWLRGKN